MPPLVYYLILGSCSALLLVFFAGVVYAIVRLAFDKFRASLQVTGYMICPAIDDEFVIYVTFSNNIFRSYMRVDDYSHWYSDHRLDSLYKLDGMRVAYRNTMQKVAAEIRATLTRKQKSVTGDYVVHKRITMKEEFNALQMRIEEVLDTALVEHKII